jgi:hypothetical protein
MIMALYKNNYKLQRFFTSLERAPPPVLLDRRLGGPQNRSGRCGEEKYLAPPRNPAQALQPVAC